VNQDAVRNSLREWRRQRRRSHLMLDRVEGHGSSHAPNFTLSFAEPLLRGSIVRSTPIDRGDYPDAGGYALEFAAYMGSARCRVSWLGLGIAWPFPRSPTPRRSAPPLPNAERSGGPSAALTEWLRDSVENTDSASSARGSPHNRPSRYNFTTVGAGSRGDGWKTTRPTRRTTLTP
jgi:hypothetical protein